MYSFSFRELTLISFIFYSWFLSEPRHKLHLSKSVCGIFHFRFRFVFIKAWFFVQQKARTLWIKNIIPFKIKIIEKPPTFSPPPRLLNFKLQQKLLKFNDTCVGLELHKKLTRRQSERIYFYRSFFKKWDLT